MAEEISRDGQVPPAGEAIHLPGPSSLPAIVAFGLTIALVGVVLNWVVCGLGAGGHQRFAVVDVGPHGGDHHPRGLRDLAQGLGLFDVTEQ